MEGGIKPHRISQSFFSLGEARCHPAEPDAQMEGRQAQADTLPSAKYRSQPREKCKYIYIKKKKKNKKSSIIKQELIESIPGRYRSPQQRHGGFPSCKSLPLSPRLGAGEMETRGDVLRSKPASLAMHGCCQAASGAARHEKTACM